MVFLNGEALNDFDPDGTRVRDAAFLLMFNAHHESIPFVLPSPASGARWLTVMDTAHQGGLTRGGAFEPGGTYTLQGRSFVLMQQQNTA